MGTNYYLRTKTPAPCPTCGRGDRAAEIHIGKSAAGWNFSLRIYPMIDGLPNEHLAPFGTSVIVELSDWRPLFEQHEIWNEYDKRVTADEMIATITKRSHPLGLTSQCRIGPGWDGGFRQRSDVFEGLGTYDLCNYSFS